MVTNVTKQMSTEWFRDRLKQKKISQRGLAKLLNIDPAAASLMLRAKRKMTSHEAHQIAQILGVPLNEIMRQAGIDVIDDVRRVSVTSFMDEHGHVSLMPARTHDTVIGPADCPIGTYAIQVRSPTTVKDGWLLFVNPAQAPANDNIDKLCSNATHEGKQLVGVIRRGYRRDTHNLILWPSNNIASDVTLAWSSSVLWIKP
jgi:plasmid maintenance system antidote protein VapI